MMLSRTFSRWLRRRWTFGLVAGLGLLISGCVSPPEETNNGLPYWPPGPVVLPPLEVRQAQAMERASSRSSARTARATARSTQSFQGDEEYFDSDFSPSQNGGAPVAPVPVTGPIPTVRPPGAPPSEAAWRSAADRWIGVPYRLGGEDRSGVDCSAFTRAMYREVTGIELPRTTYDQFQSGEGVEFLSVRAGDLVFFMPQPGEEGLPHVGVMVDRREFAHASVRGGVAYAFLEQRPWRERITGIRRIVPFP